VAFHATLDADLSPLEEALERAGFDPDPKITEGWRWRAKEGFATVKIEFSAISMISRLTARSHFRAASE
jgi:hypothetical protein